MSELPATFATLQPTTVVQPNIVQTVVQPTVQPVSLHSLKWLRGELIRCQRNGLYGEASCTFEMLKDYEDTNDKVSENSKVRIDSNCWNMMIALCENDLELTYAVFLHIKEKYQLTEISYTTLIKRLCEHEAFGDAFTLLAEMIEMSVRNSSIRPHLRTIAPFFGKKLEDGMFEKLCDIIQENELIPTLELFVKMMRTNHKIGNSPQKMLVWIQTYYDSVPEELCHVICDCVRKNAIPVSVDSFGVCSNCKWKLEKMDFSEEERQIFLTALQQHFAKPFITKLEKFLKFGTKYDVVIDGANVCLYNNAKFNQKKLEAVVDYFTQKKSRVLIVFNIGRKHEVAKMTFFDDRYRNKHLVDVYYSDKGCNDDLFWLYCGFYYRDALVVTDDKMGDHIFKIFNKLGIHIFWKWANCHVVKFHFQNDGGGESGYFHIGSQKKSNRNERREWLQLTIPKSYSEKIQMTKFHVPVLKDSNHHIEWQCFDHNALDLNDEIELHLRENTTKREKRERTFSETGKEEVEGKEESLKTQKFE